MKSYVQPRPLSTSSHLLQGLTFLMLMCTTYGVCLRASDTYGRWHTDRRILQILHIIHNRQLEYRQVSHTFASSFEALHVRLPAELKATLFAGPLGTQPSYAAEVCSQLQCWLIDQRGEPLQRREAKPLPRARPNPVEASAQATMTGESVLPARAPSELQPGSQPQAQLETLPGSQRPAQLVAQPGSQLEAQPGSQLVAQPGSQLEAQPGAQPQAQPGAGLEAQPGGQPQAQPGDQSDVQQARAPATVMVVPRAPARAFGLKAGTPLPPLSPTRDTAALWGPLEEVRR